MTKPAILARDADAFPPRDAGAAPATEVPS